MKPGLYDDLVTDHLIHEIERLKTDGIVPLFGKIEPAQLPEYLTRFLAAQLAKAIRIYGSNDADRQIELANAIIESISAKSDELAFLLNERIARTDEHDVLEELSTTTAQPSPRPLTELSASSLLTGAPGLPQLGREIELELATADRCDMLVAFVKSGGMRLLREPLKKFTERGGILRLITTSYMGASDPAVVEELAKLPIRVRLRRNHLAISELN
jgi:hypothetical protein